MFDLHDAPCDDYLADDSTEESRMAKLFALRMLLRISSDSRMFTCATEERRVQTCLGFVTTSDNCNQTRIEIQEQLKRLLSEPSTGEEDALARNLRKVSATLGLTAPERTLLHFVVLMQESPLVSYLSDVCRGATTKDLVRFLADVTGAQTQCIARALAPTSVLHITGLLRLDRTMSSRAHIKARLDLMCESRTILTSEQFEPEELLASTSTAVRKSELCPGDFRHLEGELEVATRLLHRAAQDGVQGVNVLLWGPPGTGKTECARMLCHSVSVDGREIACLNTEGEAMKGSERLTALAMSSLLLRNRKNVVLIVDEMDELADSMHLGRLRSSVGKARLNEVMEHTPLPVIWVSNDAEQFDSAIVRRFSMVINFSEIPAEVRQAMVRRKLGNLKLDDSQMADIAECDQLPPACVANLTRVINLTASGDDAKQSLHARVVMDGYLALLSRGRRRQRPPQMNHVANRIPYDINFLNTDVCLSDLVARIKQITQARLCLFGPPGTGKTAFGRELANQLGQNLVVRRASDLLGAYVGETEKAIADAFREASQTQGVLLIDEAESFLLDRTSARHRWEISQVNEFLTQMEYFSGILVCSTNLHARLDGASARRFDLQIEFQPLEVSQAMALLSTAAANLGFDESMVAAAETENKIRRALPLTIGDFQKALNAAQLLGGLSSVDDIVVAIERVAAEKRGREGRRIGFV